jgi:hypothetical protein
MYYQVLQCPLTTNIGWLLWSFRRIDTECLQQEIEDVYDIQVNLRYQNVSIGQGKVSGENMVRALHVVVNQEKADQISNVFQHIYSFTSDIFPLGICMRFIPHVLRVTKDKIPKIRKWRARQNAFLKVIEDQSRPMTATSWEIMLLDSIIRDFGTLRKRLMEIKAKSNTSEFLFLSVDVSFFRSNEVIFSFLPRHEQDARTFVANIVPYFLHKYGRDQIRDIFYQEALDRAEQSVWNADTEEIVSPADLYIDQSGDIMDDFDFLEVIGYGNTTSPAEENEIKNISRVERLFTGEDSTSVGTLFTEENQRENLITCDKASALNGETNDIPNVTTRTIGSTTKSVTTSITIEELDQNMTKLSNEMAEIKSLLKNMVNNKTNNNTQTNDDAGASNTDICNDK